MAYAACEASDFEGPLLTHTGTEKRDSFVFFLIIKTMSLLQQPVDFSDSCKCQVTLPYRMPLRY